MNDALVVIGAALVILSGVPYIIDIIRKKTRPNVVSWLTWTLLITIGAFAALAAGETKTAIITFGDAIQAGIILLLGLRYGYAKFSRFDGDQPGLPFVPVFAWLNAIGHDNSQPKAKKHRSV